MRVVLVAAGCVAACVLCFARLGVCLVSVVLAGVHLQVPQLGALVWICLSVVELALV